MGHDDESSTTRGLPSSPRRGVERWVLRLGLLVLVLIVLAGSVGLLGPRDGEARAAAEGYELDVVYPAISRAGEPAPLHVRVESETPFAGPIELGLCDDLFDDLDFQSWYPMPSKETGDTAQLRYEFDPPGGTVFEVSLDARVAPGQFGEVEDCTVAVLEDGVELVSLSFDSWRMP